MAKQVDIKEADKKDANKNDNNKKDDNKKDDNKKDDNKKDDNKKDDNKNDDNKEGVSEYLKTIKILYSKQEIDKRVKELGREISKDYANKPLIVVGLLRGAFIFMADLVRSITVPHQIDFMVISSYHGTRRSNTVKIKQDMSIDPHEKNILIVEDLIDTGATLSWLIKHFKNNNALSIEIVTLLDKKTVQRTKENQINIKYVGFDCGNEFVVGYGMDYDQHYRSLDCIGILNPEVYENEKKDKVEETIEEIKNEMSKTQ